MRKFFFSDLSCTHGRTCVYGRYAPLRGGRPTRLLPHALNAAYSNKIVFPCWVNYALEGSAFILSKCDFSRMFQTEGS